MSIQTEISRISTNVSNALNAIAQRGVTIPSGSGSGNLSELIASIPEGIVLPGFMHRLEFFTFTLSAATDRVLTEYDLTLGESYSNDTQYANIYNRHVPNFAIGWTNDPVGNYQVIKFFKFEDFFAQKFQSDVIYAQGYGHYHSAARSIVIAQEMSERYASIRFKPSVVDTITGRAPSYGFNFAPNVTYNLILGRWKDEKHS